MPKLTPRRLLFGGLALVAVVLVLANRIGGGGEPPQYARPAPSAPATAAPSASMPVPASPTATEATEPRDDGVAPDPIIPPAPEHDQAVREVAITFATWWLRAYDQTAEQWFEGLLPFLTDEMAVQLEGVNPRGSVPVGKVNDSKVETAPLGEGLWEVKVPIFTDLTKSGKLTGTLTLTLKADGDGDGDWRVSEIDWERKR
jgi:hypothetical protein